MLDARRSPSLWSVLNVNNTAAATQRAKSATGPRMPNSWWRPYIGSSANHSCTIRGRPAAVKEKGSGAGNV